METGNRLCGDCGCKVADFFCSCTEPETFLCEEHLSKHTRKMSRKGHQSWPISALRNYKNPRFLDRLEAFPRVRDEAMEAIREVDRAIAELSATVEELKSTLLALFTEKMNELQEIKANLMREIPAALEEVERTLPEEQPVLISEYSALIRGCAERCSSLQIFTCAVKACPPQSFFSVCYHFASPPPPERLAGLYNNQAFLYDIQSQQISKRTISVSLGSGSSYVVVDYNTLLCVGAMPASNEACPLSSSLRCIPSPLHVILLELRR